LRKEIAPHLKFLKKQAEKIEKAESLREELINQAKGYFKIEENYISVGKFAIAEEKKPTELSLKNLSEELASAKKVLEDSAKGKDKNFQVLDLEAEIAGARAHKDGLSRELGKIEGSLSAEERIIRKEQELQTSEEHKMIRLKEVEEVLAEVSIFTAVDKIIARLKDFIKERKHSADSSVILGAEKEIEKLKKDKEKTEKSLVEAGTKEKALQAKYETLKKEIEQDKDSSRDAEKAVFRIMSEEQGLLSKLNILKVKEATLASEDEAFKRELSEVGQLVGPEVLRFKEHVASADNHSREEMRHHLERLKIRFEESGISGAGEVLKEFKDVTERDEFLARELIDLDSSATSLKELIKDLEVRLATEFSTGLAKINKEFGELFTMMFGGGEAHLTLTREKKNRTEMGDLDEGSPAEDSTEEEVVEEGMDISVNLPRKKIRGLLMLSGGERALTSIALLFAISRVNPPPFIILDETDAALDEANSKKYGDMAVRLANHSQLILITHNRETMSRAGIIYGVTMSSNGISKLLSIEFDQAVEVAK